MRVGPSWGRSQAGGPAHYRNYLCFRARRQGKSLCAAPTSGRKAGAAAAAAISGLWRWWRWCLVQIGGRELLDQGVDVSRSPPPPPPPGSTPHDLPTRDSYRSDGERLLTERTREHGRTETTDRTGRTTDGSVTKFVFS